MKAPLAIAATVVLWASAFPAVRVGLDGYGPFGLSVLRLAVASVALLLAAPLLGVRLPKRKDLPLIALCGLTGMTAYQLLLNWGEVHVPAGTASLLVATAPVFSAGLAAVWLGERLTGRKIAGSVVALAGSALIAVSGGTVQYSAAAWVLLAAAAVQGVYHFATKPLLRTYSGLEVACYAIWAGTIFSLPLAPEAVRGIAHAPLGATLAVLFLALLPSAVGFVLWGYGVARYSVTVATAALYLVPVVAVAVSFVWLGEVPRPIELIGGAVSIAGVVLISVRKEGQATIESPPAGTEPRGKLRPAKKERQLR
jgi:drug/metabolite transporter (DMT)-like permease